MGLLPTAFTILHRIVEPGHRHHLARHRGLPAQPERAVVGGSQGDSRSAAGRDRMTDSSDMVAEGRQAGSGNAGEDQVSADGTDWARHSGRPVSFSGEQLQRAALAIKDKWPCNDLLVLAKAACEAAVRNEADHQSMISTTARPAPA